MLLFGWQICCRREPLFKVSFDGEWCGHAEASWGVHDSDKTDEVMLLGRCYGILTLLQI